MAISLAHIDRLLLATHNSGKLAEFADLLGGRGIDIVSAAELGLHEPEETGRTFHDNAAIKAVAAARVSGLLALADDSGLSVDALDGAPGVRSARWAGKDRDFGRAMHLVEERLAEAGAISALARGARFIAVICLASPDGQTESFAGEVAGNLVWPPRGTNGFGYDPIFVPAGEDRTFGEMTAPEKRALSHRVRAFEAFAEARLVDR